MGLLPIRGAAFESGKDLSSCTYGLKEGGELWASIGPPRPYRWSDSLRHRLLWQGSWLRPQLAVPQDAKIERWAEHVNILWLQSENMLWQSWHEVNKPWLRYFVSGYNVSNAIGVVCNNAGYWIPTQRQNEMVLRTNCRLAYMPFDPDEYPNGKTVRIVNLRPEEVERRHRHAMSTWYWPRLDASYRCWFEAVNASGEFAMPAPEAP